MYQLETWRSRQAVLPLPPASLVIDLRVDDDDMIKRLEIEIADLTNEMKTQETHHWRFLADFLSFWRIQPMGTGEINTLRPQQDASTALSSGGQSTTTGTQVSNPTQPADNFQTGLTGPIVSSTQQLNNSAIFFESDVGLSGLSGDQPADVLKQYADKIIDEADRLRNNRTVAIGDLDPNLNGPSMRDKTVRVILVTDAEQPDSLATAAAYAERLRQFRAQKQRANQEMMLNLTVLCLNASGNSGSDELCELLWDDRWDHIDSLIISERYRHDGVRIAGPIQTYLAELLLYVLLIVPPVPVNLSQSPAITQPQPAPANQGATEKAIAFPPSTFLVGLATMEHSARWGRHLLNFKVVERSIEVLQQDREEERERTKNIARSWLDRWRGKLRSLIPQHVPETIAGMRGVTYADNAVETPEQVFTVSNFSWSLGETTITDLQRYLKKLTSTYVLLGPAQGNSKVLQEAIDSIPQLEQQLKAWESKDPEQRKEMPLANAQLEAQRVLSHPDFFTGAQGAISRARIQLEELSRAIIQLRSTWHPVDLKARHQELERQGKAKIEALSTDIQSIPRLGTIPFLRGLMAWLSLLLILFIGVVLTFVVVAWLESLPSSNLSPFFYNLVYSPDSPLPPIFWTVLLILILALLFLLGRRLLESTRSAWNVEIGFVLVLLPCLWGLSWAVSASEQRVIDPALLGWLSFFPTLGRFAFGLAVLLVIGECCYFLFWWLPHLQRSRRKIVADLNALHKENVETVTAFIADSIAFFLLERTELINQKSEPGKYYERLKKLDEHFRRLFELAGERQGMVRRRLDLSFSETQPGAKLDPQAPWLNLHIRDERLDVGTLADGYTRLNERLGQEMEELRDLAEQLVRSMGQEQPAVLEKEFRERSQAQYSVRRYPQVLMTTLVATAQRISIKADTLTSIQPLILRYKTLENSFSNQLSLMKALIDTIGHRLTRIMLQPVLQGQVQASEQDVYKLSIDAFETWGQMLWEGQDQELDRALASTGVMPKLLDAQDNAAFVKRLLALRTSLFGQSVQPGQIGDLFVLVPPSPQSHVFRQSLNLSRRHLVEFPDVERLILLCIQRSAALPMQIALPPVPGSNGQALPTGQAQPVSQSTTPPVTSSPPKGNQGP
jgi:hypothetical protein